MTRLVTLGRIALLDAGGTDLGLAPQPLAILAFLAVRGGGGGVRRDELMALFWPESDAERARTALRAALYRLRQSLGDDLIDSRGAGVLALTEGRISCDAVLFKEACERGDWDGAMAHFGGTFLPGLHLSGARGFDDWHEAEGSRLAKLANAACWQLAERDEAAGEHSGAARWATRAMALDPYSEPGLQGQMKILARFGDRAGLVFAFQDFTERLNQELELEPAAETVEAFQALVAEADRVAEERPHTPFPADADRFEPAPAERRTEHPAPTSPNAPPVRWSVTMRSRVVLGLLGVATLAMVFFRSLPSPVDVATIAVLPFDYTGDAEHVYLGGGVSDILSRRLETMEGVRVTGGADGLLAGGSPDDPADVMEALIAAGVHYYVSGSVEVVGSSLELSAELHRAGRARALVTASASGSIDSAFSLIDDLLGQLVVGQVATWGSAPLTIPGGAPGLEALRAYLEGEAHIQAGRHQEALAVFRRAVRQDSAFAWAHYGRSRAAEWAGEWGEAQRAADRAWELRVQLPVRERGLLEAWRASLVPHPVRADTLFAMVAAGYPGFGEAWLRLAEHRYHWGPLIGRPVDEGVQAFEQTTRLMPRNAEALLHLLRLKVRRGSSEEALEIVRLIRDVGPGGAEEAETDLLRALLVGDSVTVDDMLTNASQFLEFLVLAITVNTPDPGSSLRGLRRITARPGVAALATRVAHLRRAASMGRLDEVDGVLEAVARTDPTLAVEYAAELATLPGLPVNSERIRAAREGVEAMPIQRPEDTAEFPEELVGVILPSRRHYVLGLLALAEGDVPAALDFAARAREEGEHPHDSDFRARTLEAAALLQRDEPDGALEALGAPDFGTGNMFPQAWTFESPRNRFIRAEALARLGRRDEALRWYRTFPEPTGSDLAYLPVVRLGEARLLLSMDRPEAARAAYRAYLEFRSGADPAVIDAMARIEDVDAQADSGTTGGGG